MDVTKINVKLRVEYKKAQSVDEIRELGLNEKVTSFVISQFRLVKDIAVDGVDRVELFVLEVSKEVYAKMLFNGTDVMHISTLADNGSARLECYQTVKECWVTKGKRYVKVTKGTFESETTIVFDVNGVREFNTSAVVEWATKEQRISTLGLLEELGISVDAIEDAKVDEHKIKILARVGASSNVVEILITEDNTINVVNDCVRMMNNETGKLFVTICDTVFNIGLKCIDCEETVFESGKLAMLKKDGEWYIIKQNGDSKVLEFIDQDTKITSLFD